MKTTEIINAKVASRIAKFVDAELIENGVLKIVKVKFIDRLYHNGLPDKISIRFAEPIAKDDNGRNIDRIHFTFDKFDNTLITLGLPIDFDLEGQTVQIATLFECGAKNIWVPGNADSFDGGRQDIVTYITGIVNE